MRTTYITSQTAKYFWLLGLLQWIIAGSLFCCLWFIIAFLNSLQM